MHLTSVNPTTGERLEVYAQDTDQQAEAKVRQAAAFSREWRRIAFPERAVCLRKIAVSLRDRRHEFSRLMAREMGKPVRQGTAEIEKCAVACDYFARNAARFLEPEEVATEADRSLVCFQPLGAVLAVMPWNFPFWQVIRCAAPALMAGNTLVLKHASNVTGCALALGEIFAAAFPSGAFSVLLLESKRLGSWIEHPDIRAVTLTGSVDAGRKVAALAGAALKKTVLELGGSDAYIVLEDADLEMAVRTCAAARLVNGGQSCVAAKRFVVIESIREEFEARFQAALQAARMGDPLQETTDLGPLARTELRDELHDQVVRSIRKGAHCRLGGSIPAGPGAFYPASLLTAVEPGMAVFDEETFGPVGAVISARDSANAVELANHSVFGLGSAIFTSDVQNGERIATHELQAGLACVNGQVRSDPRMPFGGVKDSGFGRELGTFGIREFVNIKSVMVGG